MTKYGLAINLDRCVGCRTCTISCKMENQVADTLQRIRVLNPEETMIYDAPTGEYPNLEMTWTPIPCQQCDNAPCVAVCPTGASIKREDGIVVVDDEVCIGCKSCIEACPYGARQFDEATVKIEKCTLCAHRIDEEIDTTICQISCPGRALVMGDLEDEGSEIGEIIAGNDTTHLLEEEKTGPQVYYWRSLRLKP